MNKEEDLDGLNEFSKELFKCFDSASQVTTSKDLKKRSIFVHYSEYAGSVDGDELDRILEVLDPVEYKFWSDEEDIGEAVFEFVLRDYEEE